MVAGTIPKDSGLCFNFNLFRIMYYKKNNTLKKKKLIKHFNFSIFCASFVNIITK